MVTYHRSRSGYLGCVDYSGPRCWARWVRVPKRRFWKFQASGILRASGVPLVRSSSEPLQVRDHLLGVFLVVPGELFVGFLVLRTQP